MEGVNKGKSRISMHLCGAARGKEESMAHCLGWHTESLWLYKGGGCVNCYA